MSSHWKLLISIAILVHFSSLCVAYSANQMRSPLQDRVLVFLQPYLIGFNFYPETLPVELIADENPPSSTRISISSSGQGEWSTVLSTQVSALESLSLHGLKSRRLLQLLSALSKNEDEDGILRILESVAMRVDSIDFKLGTVDKPFDKIRLELPGVPTDDGGLEPVFVEALVARFEDGEIGLVPKVEPHRSVRSKLNESAKP